MTTEQLLPPEQEPQRRVAVLPLVIAAVAVMLAVVFAVVVLGLARTGAPESAVTGGAASASPSAPVEATPPAGPRREAEINECVDELGDAEVDLESAQVADDDGRLVTRITLDAAVPDGLVTLGVFAVNGAGDVIYQLAATFDDGQLDEFFAQRFGVGQSDDNRGRGNGNDDGGTETDDLDFDDLDFDGTTMVATFPKAVLRDLGTEWSWYAFTAVDGDEVDACPGLANSRETQAFVRDNRD